MSFLEAGSTAPPVLHRGVALLVCVYGLTVVRHTAPFGFYLSNAKYRNPCLFVLVSFFFGGAEAASSQNLECQFDFSVRFH